MIKEMNSALRPNRRFDERDIELLGLCLALGLKQIASQLEEADWEKTKALSNDQVRLETMQRNLREEWQLRYKNSHLEPLETL